MNTIKLRALREIASASAANLALPISAVATAPLVARALGSQARGEFAALTSPVVLVGVLGTLGLQDLSTQLLASRGLSVVDVRRLLVRCSGVLAVWNLFLAFIFTVVAANGGSALHVIVLFFMFSMPTAVATSLLHGIAVGRGMFPVVNLNRSLTAALRLVLIASVFAMGALTLVTALVIFAFVQVVVFLAMMRSLHAWLMMDDFAHARASSADTPSTLRSLQSAMGLLVGAGLAVSLARLDQSLALPLVGAAQLGFYAVAVAIFEIPTAIAAAIRMYVMGSPAFNAPSRASILRIVAATMVAGGFVAFVGYAMAGWAIPFVFGDAFREAVSPTRTILLGLPFAFGLATCAAVFVRQERNAAQAWCYVLALACNGVLLFWLGPRFGAAGLSAASACAFGLGLLVAVSLIVVQQSRPVAPIGSSYA